MPRALSFSFSPASLQHKETSAEERSEAFRGWSRKFRKGWPGHLPALKKKWCARDPRLTPKSALGRSFVVKQRSSLSRPLRDDTKNGCEADFNYGSIIICSKREKHPSVLSPPPPPSHLSSIVIFSVPVVRLENPFPGVRHLSILLEAVDIVPFSIFNLKMLV